MSRGSEEGDTCNRDGCEGTMTITQDPCCCSAISCPPCSACERSRLECDECYCDPEDDEPLTALDKLKEYRYENTQ